MRLKSVLSFVLILTAFRAFAGVGWGESGSVFLTSLPPNAPVLASPANGATAVPESAWSRWRTVTHAASYAVQISTQVDFSSTVINATNISDTTFSLASLARNTLHFWRTRATNVAGTGPWSPIWYFSTAIAAPNAPALAQPPDGSASVNPQIELSWNDVPGAATYHLQVSTVSSFSSLAIDQSGIAATRFAAELEAQKIYHWRVAAENDGGKSPFSEAWTFGTWSTAITKDAEKMPTAFALLPVYPNPFNSSVTLTYQVPRAAQIEVYIYNTVGHVVQTLASGVEQAGSHTVQWNGLDSGGLQAPSGMYFCCFKADHRTFFQKMLLIR